MYVNPGENIQFLSVCVSDSVSWFVSVCLSTCMYVSPSVVYACIYTLVYICGVCMHIHTCIWRPELDIRYISQSLLYLFFEIFLNILLTWTSSFLLYWLRRKLQGFASLTPNTG